MLGYLPLIQKLLLGYVTQSRFREKLAENTKGAGLFGIAAFFCLIAIVFIFLAVQSYFQMQFIAPVAWLLTASIALIMGAVLFLCGQWVKDKKNPIERLKPKDNSIESGLQELMEHIGEPIKDHPIASVALAVLAGLLAGDKISSKDEK